MSFIIPAPLATANAVNAACKSLLASFRKVGEESGKAKVAASFAVRTAAACLVADITRLSSEEAAKIGSMRQGVRVESRDRKGEKIRSEESVPVMDIVEALCFGGAAIRSGKIVG
jgi:hypothetical protein